MDNHDDLEFRVDPPEETPAPLNEQVKPVKHKSFRRELFTLTLIAVIAISVALFIRFCVAQAYEIHGESMHPTYQTGNHVILLKLSPEWIPVNHEDLVIFTHPDNPERNLVKRVLGTAGDDIMISGGKVYVNGKLEDYSKWGDHPVPHTFPRGIENTWHVPENSYFVLGDNRENSQDSRDMGVVPEHLIKGKILFRWWPIFSNN